MKKPEKLYETVVEIDERVVPAKWEERGVLVKGGNGQEYRVRKSVDEEQVER